MFAIKRAFVVIPVVLIGFACADDTQVTADTVAARAGTIASAIVENGGSAIADLAELNTLESFATALDNLAMGAAADTAPAEGGGVLVEDEPNAEEVAAEIEKMLSDLIFTDDNLESSSASSATFLLGPALCEYLGSEEVYEECVGAACPAQGDDLDSGPDCQEALTALELRIVAELVGDDGVDLTFAFGPERSAPLKLQLRPNSLAAEVDLLELKAALAHIASALGEQEIQLPETFEGRLRVSLAVPDNKTIQLSSSVLSAVAISGEVEQGTVLVQVAAADPLISFTADTLGETVGVTLDLNQVDVTLPYALVTEDDADTGTFGIHLGGLSFDILLDEGAESLSIADVGFGDTTTALTLDGAEVVGVDLNQNAGRTFSLDVEPTATSAILTVTPMLDVELRLALALIADALDPADEVPGFAMSDSLSVTLAGEGSAAIEPLEQGIRVVSGSLEIAAGSADAAIVVDAGQCLLGRDDLNPRPGESHELLQLLEAGSCQ